MKFDRSVNRKARQTLKLLTEGGQKADGLHVLGSSQAEALISMRSMLIPPAPPGSGDDEERDRVDPVEYRREMNARKRARRARK